MGDMCKSCKYSEYVKYLSLSNQVILMPGKLLYLLVWNTTALQQRKSTQQSKMLKNARNAAFEENICSVLIWLGFFAS